MTSKRQTVLKQMLDEQRKHNEHFVNFEGLTDIEREQFTKDYVLLAIDELIELLRCTDYKRHRIQKVEKDVSNVLEESIDVFKYILSICLIWGIEETAFLEMFDAKSKVVEDRYRQEQIELTEKTKLICVDLDGVVSDWAAGIYNWYWGGLYEYYQDGHAHHDSYDIGSILGVDKITAEKVKLNFMTGGGFRDLPLINGAKEGMKELRAMKFKLALITARPYLEHRRVYADTIYWLEGYDIPYDFIFWGKDKADIIFRELAPIHPIYFIEDRDKHAIELSNERIEVILLDWPYNRHIGENIPHITRVKNWTEIVNLVWKEASKEIRE